MFHKLVSDGIWQGGQDVNRGCGFLTKMHFLLLGLTEDREITESGPCWPKKNNALAGRLLLSRGSSVARKPHYARAMVALQAGGAS